MGFYRMVSNTERYHNFLKFCFPQQLFYSTELGLKKAVFFWEAGGGGSTQMHCKTVGSCEREVNLMT